MKLKLPFLCFLVTEVWVHECVFVSACVLKLFQGTEVSVLPRAQRSVWVCVL